MTDLERIAARLADLDKRLALAGAGRVCRHVDIARAIARELRAELDQAIAQHRRGGGCSG
jgi:hypothetical protein